MDLSNTAFDYLDERDSREFEDYIGNEYQELLVSGNKSLYRLEKYLPEHEFHRLRVALTALVKDFKLPNLRFTTAIAMSFYAMALSVDSNVSEDTKRIVELETALLIEHLSDDDGEDGGHSERELFDIELARVSKHWNNYLDDPNGYIIPSH